MSELGDLKKRIEVARSRAKKVFGSRAELAGMMSGAPGLVDLDVEFPDPDMLHVYQTIFGRRVGEPTVYRLSFGLQLKWVGVSHPWGVKPADVVVPEE
jgi:hypothetical protein